MRHEHLDSLTCAKWLRYGPHGPIVDRMVHTDEEARLAAYLASYIEDKNWSEREAALNLGLKRSTLRRRLEHGGFKLWELRLIADRLGTTTSELARRAEVAA